jgi:hypothetical protein
MLPTPIYCRCGVLLGASDGRQLFAGLLVFHKPLTMACIKCGAMRKWTPMEVVARVEDAS